MRFRGVSRLLRSVAILPLRGVSSGVKTASALGALTAATAATAVSAGAEIAATPLRRVSGAAPRARAIAGTAALVAEVFGGNPRRRSWRGHDRCWIEVRGLDDPAGGPEVGAAVLEAVRAQPGVQKAQLNRPLSRLIVCCDGDEPTLRTLCGIVTAAEQHAHHCGTRARRDHPTDLPGDGVLLAASLAAATVSTAGLCAVAAGRALLWPRFPTGLAAAVIVVDYQPRLRRLVEDRLGPSAADTVLAVATSAAYTVRAVLRPAGRASVDADGDLSAVDVPEVPVPAGL